MDTNPEFDDPFFQDSNTESNRQDFRESSQNNWNLQNANKNDLNQFNKNLKNIFGNINKSQYLATQSFNQNNYNTPQTLPVAGQNIETPKKFPYALILALIIICMGIYFGKSKNY